MSSHIVMLAGGQSSRLGTYRTVVAKPLMPVGDRPVLDLMLRQAARHGFTDVTLAVGDLAPLLRAMFGDGGRLGLSIDYSEEAEPLGTAGALRPLAFDEPFLVMNGNAVTTLDLRRFYESHLRSGNAVTVATHRREVLADFGVLQLGTAGDEQTMQVSQYVEKPRIAYTVSMGIYAVQPDVRDYIADGEHLGFPALVERLIDAERRVGAYEHDGLWLDVRRPDDYEQAATRYDEIAPFFADAPVREAA
jgi:NDP-sugar pyrophosphorylase family protein